MQLKNQVSKRAILALLTLTLFILSITVSPTKSYAAGWLDGEIRQLTLGETVHGSMMENDKADNGYVYRHVYSFNMPINGLLTLYLESEEAAYFTKNYYPGASFYIYPASNPDRFIWQDLFGNHDDDWSFSSARGVYYGSMDISLDMGEYYFVIEHFSENTPYYLTLSYKEPTINVNSISLNPSIITMGVGTQQTISATILPNNATDKTITWQSADSSIATVDQGVVTGVSAGTTIITASSSDGEITASCIVTVTCPHDYQTSFTPATKNDNGYFTEQCKKCGNTRQDRVIHAINNISLSKKSVSYNGKVQMPSVIVQDSQGKYLTYNTDYTLSFTGDMRNVGKHSVRIKFKGNYKGSATRAFTILPQPTAITKLKIKKKGFSASWKKQNSPITGYELAYSTSGRFSKSKTKIVTLGRSKTKKTIAKLRKGKRYYVRVRTYKNITENGQTAKLYSNWSKTKTVVTKR